MVFYRKYRPQKFSDVVGQEPIIQTLTNALAQGTYSHGYLFAGPRGSGKTTLARIFAKALNCSGRKLGSDSYEPCNKCLSCKEITLGKSLDLIEIDAASNRGIDEIRDLREKIRFAPTKSTYKIYIIDEVHMLTKEAFNALLKTLEEPPKHAIFVMATTEPQKVLPTILSRVQRFDFRRATVEEIKKLLKKIAGHENIKIDEDALELVAQLAFGSYRDGVSMFDQIASQRKSGASKITLLQIQETLGLAQDKSVLDLSGYLATQNRQKAFELISNLYRQGIDLENFNLKLVEFLRKIALFKMGDNQLFDLTKEQQAEVKRQAELFDLDILMAMIEKFALATYQIKTSPIPQLPLEMLIFEFTASLPQTELTANSSQLTAQKEAKIVPTEKIQAQKVASPKPEVISKFSEDLWSQIIKEARIHNHSLAALLKDAVLAGQEEDTIILAFKFKFHANMISARKNCQIIEEIVQKITGTQYKISCIVNPELVIKAPVNTEEELLSDAKEVFEIEE